MLRISRSSWRDPSGHDFRGGESENPSFHVIPISVIPGGRTSGGRYQRVTTKNTILERPPLQSCGVYIELRLLSVPQGVVEAIVAVFWAVVLIAFRQMFVPRGASTTSSGFGCAALLTSPQNIELASPQKSPQSGPTGRSLGEEGLEVFENFGSSGRIRTYNPSVNSYLCVLKSGCSRLRSSAKTDEVAKTLSWSAGSRFAN